MTDQQSSYRQIMKATSLFGGVQVFQILIQIVKSKLLAVLLGPTGMGIQGLLVSTTGLITGLTNLGIGTSAVKNVAEANSTGDSNRVALIVTVLRKLVWITGSIGTIVTLVLSPWLSELTFGNNKYSLAFAWISITLLFTQLSSGQLAILQGLRKLRYLANANLTGAFLGLVVSVPLYYFFSIDGIVPAIIATSVVSLFRSWYFARKIKIEKVKVTKPIIIAEGKDMLQMGVMLSLSGLVSLAASYLVRIFISSRGGITDVGLYTAGFAIINSYVGMVFSAMGKDFYPRLAEVANDNKKASITINQQAEISILILSPILSVFIIFINWVIILFYSSKFTNVNGMIQWAALGMFFRAASWCISYIFIAKGASKLYFFNELIANIYTLVLNIIGYLYWGLTGLGISFLISYMIYFLQAYIIAKLKFEFLFFNEFYKAFLLQFIIGIACFIIIQLISTPWAYFSSIPLIIISFWLSFKILDKKLNLKNIINTHFLKTK